MTATREDINGWLKRAKELNSTHLIIALDTYDFDNYPVYVTSDKNVQEEYNKIIESSMQRVDEVYNMSLSIEDQLKERRAMNF
jgi:gamma-glutamylcyclotransferase (GGCT)/AIG2-like uncharacterized protein YtfP